MKIQELAFAKVNLHLDVLNKRDDGYHDIGTIFQTINIHDVLEFELIDDLGIQIECDSEVTDNPEDNLIYKAAMSLKSYAKSQGISSVLMETKGVRISVEKSLPMGAGLGGGSADAAATLRGLNKLWSLALSFSILEKLGTPLGADVPFMIQGGTAIAEGIGERLRPVQPPSGFHVLIVTPSDFVSTAAAYSELVPRGANEFQKFIEQYECSINKSEKDLRGESAFLDKLYFNHFEKTVFKKHPQIEKLKIWMSKQGAVKSLMSGSGASVFGLFKDKADAESAYDAVSSVFPGLRYKKVTSFEKNHLEAESQ